jgi:hypothetical protein
MSDFKTPNDFRKGSYKKYPYQDPTYLSFALMFDWFDEEHSPLLAGPAERFIESLAGSTSTEKDSDLTKQIVASQNSFYKERLEDLQAFRDALYTINMELPWYWQSLKGLERLQQYDPLNSYWGGDDAKIEIETLESLNLPIAGLMHLYRRAIFDERKWGYIVPANLRKFRMWIYVTEIRTIQSKTATKVGGINKDTALKDFPSNIKPTVDTSNENEKIMGTGGRPYFMIGLNYCEFDLASGSNIFADLSKNPDGPVSNAITIKYEASKKVEARVLNGIVDPLTYTTNQLSPAPDSEFFDATSKSPMEFAKDKFKGKIDEISEKAKDSAKKFAEDKKRELAQMARDKTVNRIPSFENVYSNFIKRVDEASDIQQVAKDLGNVIPSNIANVAAGGTVKQALDKGAKNAVKNLGNAYD